MDHRVGLEGSIGAADTDAGRPSADLFEDISGGFRLSSRRSAEQHVVFGENVLAPENPTLAEMLGARRPLFVVTPSVARLHGETLRRYISTALSRRECEVVVLRVTEESKNFEAVEQIVTCARDFGIGRDDPMVAIGGGVCLDVVGVSAALYRRGVPNIKVPTTLVGLIDAGIGTKNAINLGESKSMLGSFSPPEASLLDFTFLKTLPERHLRNGVAEMLKMALICDGALLETLRVHGSELLRTNFQTPSAVAQDAIRRSVGEMLRELSSNLYEHTRYRQVDFGHTFSPYIESASRYHVLHGEAVAMDIAISTEISSAIGLLNDGERDFIHGLLTDLGLPHLWAGINTSDMYESLKSIRQHRSGNLHLVVPAGLGCCSFVEDDTVSFRLLDECVRKLASRSVRSIVE